MAMIAVFPDSLTAAGDASAPMAAIHSRQKRNSWQFANMMSCVTGRNSVDYIDYGCYCGMGGKGQPIDDVDWQVSASRCLRALFSPV